MRLSLLLENTKNRNINSDKATNLSRRVSSSSETRLTDRDYAAVMCSAGHVHIKNVSTGLALDAEALGAWRRLRLCLCCAGSEAMSDGRVGVGGWMVEEKKWCAVRGERKGKHS